MAKTVRKTTAVPGEPVRLPIGCHLLHFEIDEGLLTIYYDCLETDSTPVWDHQENKVFHVVSLDQIADREVLFPFGGELRQTISPSRLDFWYWFTALICRGRRPDVLAIYEVPWEPDDQESPD